MQNSRLLARLRQRACVCEHRQGSSPKRSALWVRGGSQHHQDRARVEHLQVQPKAWFSSVCFFFLKLVPKIKLLKKKKSPKNPKHHDFALLICARAQTWISPLASKLYHHLSKQSELSLWPCCNPSLSLPLTPSLPFTVDTPRWLWQELTWTSSRPH